ncbi:hypothetical protein ABBQ38_007494 [Trebouxia sp. C0009 RCD-2024]
MLLTPTLSTAQHETPKPAVCKAGIIAATSRSIAAAPALPALPACRHFLNLTNGIEALPLLESLNISYSFVRIPSTWCEQQRFDLILTNLDASFLLQLALGHCCLVWDFGSRNKKRGIPRALWYGVEFVTYILRRLWFQRCTDAWLRRQNVTSVFERHYNNLDKNTVAKLRYYMRYIPPGVTDVQLYGVSKATIHDPDPGYYRDIVLQHIWNERSATASQLSNLPEQLMADNQGNTNEDGIDMQGSDTAEVLLERFGYNIFLGGMYSVEDYRAM